MDFRFVSAVILFFSKKRHKYVTTEQNLAAEQSSLSYFAMKALHSKSIFKGSSRISFTNMLESGIDIIFLKMHTQPFLLQPPHHSPCSLIFDPKEEMNLTDVSRLIKKLM